MTTTLFVVLLVVLGVFMLGFIILWFAWSAACDFFNKEVRW